MRANRFSTSYVKEQALKPRPLGREYSAVRSVRGPPHPPIPQELGFLSTYPTVSNAARPRPCRDNRTIFDDPQRSANTLRREVVGWCDRSTSKSADERRKPRGNDGNRRSEDRSNGGLALPVDARASSTNLKLPTNPRAVQDGGNPRPWGGGCQSPKRGSEQDANQAESRLRRRALILVIAEPEQRPKNE